MSNGLDDLSGRRRQRRQAPPPKHPRSEQQPPEPSPEKGTDPVSEKPSPPEPEAAAPEAVEPPETKVRSDAQRAKRTPSVEAYLDEELLDWLWQVEAAAVAQRMRSVNSPVVRLALRRLRQEMAPEEVVRTLQENPPAPTGRPGRPRR